MNAAGGRMVRKLDEARKVVMKEILMQCYPHI